MAFNLEIPQDGILKYIKCTSAGVMNIQSEQIYGSWEFNFFKTNITSNINISIINLEKVLANDRYTFRVFDDNSIGFLYNSTELMRTVSSYILLGEWYRIRINRSIKGDFYFFIKGADYGKSYVPIDPIGGVGSNPVNENTLTTSRFFIIDMEAGDSFSSVRIKGINTFEQNNILAAYFPLAM